MLPIRHRDEGGYRQRTEANVRDSDATPIVSIAPELTGGRRETALFAQRLGKPWRHLHPGMDWSRALRGWIEATAVLTFNVASSRASGAPGIGAFTLEVLDALAAIVEFGSSAQPHRG